MILQRIPSCEFASSQHRIWFIIAIFNRLIRHSLQDLHIKAAFYRAEGCLDSKSVLRYKFHGFDFEKSDLDQRCYQIPIEIRDVSQTHIPVPYDDRYGFYTAKSAPREDNHISFLSKYSQQIRLLKRLVTTLDGFIGPRTQMLELACEIRVSHSRMKQNRCVNRGVYKGYNSIWRLERKGVSGALMPSL